MLSSDAARRALARLFERQRIADLDGLFETLDTRSRMTVFRRLSEAGYFSSYSHAGRFYTLKGVPEFDQAGLWRHQGVCFSRDGTLKATVTRLVVESDAGRFQRELQELLLVRVHNTLLDLVRDGQLGRESLLNRYLYISAERARAAAQLARRRQALPDGAVAETEPEVLAPSAVIAVLLEVIHGAGVRLDASRVATRLRARGLAVTERQVERVFVDFAPKKTTPRSRSRRSPR